MRIRPYQDSDLAAVTALFAASVHGLAVQHYTPQQCSAWAPQPPDLPQWQARLTQQTTLVAEPVAEDEAVIGFIAYGAGGHIDLLYTSPQHTRRGVASRLYQAAEHRLRQNGITDLVTEASLVAVPFFRRQGFQILEAQRVERRGVEFRRYRMGKSFKETALEA